MCSNLSTLEGLVQVGNMNTVRFDAQTTISHRTGGRVETARRARQVNLIIHGPCDIYSELSQITNTAVLDDASADTEQKGGKRAREQQGHLDPCVTWGT